MSDDLERELRVVLRDRATRVDDDLDVPGDLDARVQRLRSRRRLAIGGALAAVVLVAVGVAAIVIDRDGHGNSVRVEHPPSTSTTESPPTTQSTPTTTRQPRETTARPDRIPTRLVGRTLPGVISFFNSDGTAGRELVHLPEQHSVIGLDLAGDTLWYLVMVSPPDTGSTPCATLWRVSIAGGQPEIVVDRTYAFAVSPDGSSLAYGSSPGCGQAAADAQPRLLVRNLATGSTHELVDTRWSAHTGANAGDLISLTFPDPTIGWSPDSAHLVVGWWNNDKSWLAVLDATAEGTVPADVPTWRGSASALVGNALWYIENPGNGAPERLGRRDLASGKVVSRPSPFSPGVSQLELGPGGLLYAVTGEFEGGLPQVERWDFVHAAEVVIAPDHTSTGIKTVDFIAAG